MGKLAVAVGFVASALAVAVGAPARLNDPSLPDEENRLRQLERI
jgi:hypothetical protein